MSRTALTVAIVCVYLLAIVVIILWSGRKTKTYKDFALGGGKLPWPVLAGTMFATLVGGGTIVGYVGSYAAFGLQWMWFPLIAFIVCVPIGAKYVSPRVRKLNQYTNADLLRIRYGNGPRMICAILIVIAEFATTIGMIGTFGTMASEYLGIGKEAAMLVAVAIYIITATLGGLTGVAWTDFVQACIMFVTVFAVAIISLVLLNDAGGFQAVPVDRWDPFTGMAPLLLIGNILSTAMLNFISQSTFTQRTNAAKNAQAARKASTMYGLSVGIFIMLGIGAIGIAASVLAPDAQGDSVVVAMLSLMPGGLAAFYFAAVIAALLTTANSMALSSSMTFVRDILPFIKGKDLTDRSRLVSARVFIVVYVILAYFAVKLNDQILTWIFINYAIQASVALPLYGGLCTKKATAASGAWGLICGGGTVIVWEILKLTGVVTGAAATIHSLFLAIPLSAIAFVIGFNSKKKSTPEQLKTVDCFRNMEDYIEEGTETAEAVAE